MKKSISFLMILFVLISCTALGICAKQTPNIGKIPVLEADYGTLLSDVPLPPIDSGTFYWDTGYSAQQTVGKVGENIFYASFMPSDREKYETVDKIKVTVLVKIPVYTAHCGQTLADIKLPEGWAWCVKSPEAVGLKYGKSEHLAACSSTQTQYVNIMTEHSPGEKYTYDENGHWLVCVCGEKCEYGTHNMCIEVNGEDGISYKMCSACVYKEPDTSKSADETGDTDGKISIVEIIRQLIKKITAFFERLFKK